jgi:hypothetical protein
MVGDREVDLSNRMVVVSTNLELGTGFRPVLDALMHYGAIRCRYEYAGGIFGQVRSTERSRCKWPWMLTWSE